MSGFLDHDAATAAAADAARKRMEEIGVSLIGFGAELRCILEQNIQPVCQAIQASVTGRSALRFRNLNRRLQRARIFCVDRAKVAEQQEAQCIQLAFKRIHADLHRRSAHLKSPFFPAAENPSADECERTAARTATHRLSEGEK